MKNANVLNRVQLIGLAHFDEFVERMQREEVAEIESKVNKDAVVLTFEPYQTMPTFIPTQGERGGPWDRHWLGSGDLWVLSQGEAHLWGY